MDGHANSLHECIRSWDIMNDEAASKNGSEEGLECPVCWEGFNNTCHVPYVLWCGHSLCKSCLLDLQWATVKFPVVPLQLPLFITCPWCQFLSCRLVWKGKLKYPCKNYFLLWLVESVKGDAKNSYDDAKPEEKPLIGTSFTHQLQCYYQGTSSLRLWEIFQQPDTADMSFVQRFFKKMMGLGTQLIAKFLLLILVMFILFCVLPFSAVVLVLYFAATIVFAFPSFLVVYFAFPSLSWLLREIVT